MSFLHKEASYAEDFLRKVKAKQALKALGYKQVECIQCKGHGIIVLQDATRHTQTEVPCGYCEQRGYNYEQHS